MFFTYFIFFQLLSQLLLDYQACVTVLLCLVTNLVEYVIIFFYKTLNGLGPPVLSKLIVGPLGLLTKVTPLYCPGHTGRTFGQSSLSHQTVHSWTSLLADMRRQTYVSAKKNKNFINKGKV